MSTKQPNGSWGVQLMSVELRRRVREAVVGRELVEGTLMSTSSSSGPAERGPLGLSGLPPEAELVVDHEPGFEDGGSGYPTGDPAAQGERRLPAVDSEAPRVSLVERASRGELGPSPTTGG